VENIQRWNRVISLLILAGIVTATLPLPCLAEADTTKYEIESSRHKNRHMSAKNVEGAFRDPLRSPSPITGNGQDTYFHIIQNTSARDVVQVELHNPQRSADGEVTADLYLNLKTYIAYGLTFEQANTSGEWLASMPFQPLWRAPEPIYVGRVTFKPGGYLLIRQAKLGDQFKEQAFMILIDTALLAVYLVGADPPVDTLSGISAGFEAISIIPVAEAVGEIGALVTDIIRKASITTIALDIADLAQIDKVAESISRIADKLLHVVISSQTIKKSFNVLEWFRGSFRVGAAIVELLAAPSQVETRITLAPMLHEQPEFPVLRPGEQTEIYFKLQNLGSQTWETGRYALVNVNDAPLGARPQMALNVDVPSGSTVMWRFPITAPSVPGVYRTEWRFSYDGQLIGPLIWMDVIVVPGGSDDLAGIIRNLIDEARRRGEEWFREQWEELRRQIIELIWAEIMRQIEEFLAELCGGSAATGALFLAVLWLGRRRSRSEDREH